MLDQMSAKKIEINDVTLTLSDPHEATGKWIGQAEILKQLLACWIVVDDKDAPALHGVVQEKPEALTDQHPEPFNELREHWETRFALTSFEQNLGRDLAVDRPGFLIGFNTAASLRDDINLGVQLGWNGNLASRGLQSFTTIGLFQRRYPGLRDEAADPHRVHRNSLLREALDLVAVVDARRAAVEAVEAGSVRGLVADEDRDLARGRAPGQAGRRAQRALHGLGAAAADPRGELRRAEEGGEAVDAVAEGQHARHVLVAVVLEGDRAAAQLVEVALLIGQHEQDVDWTFRLLRHLARLFKEKLGSTIGMVEAAIFEQAPLGIESWDLGFGL